MNDKDQFKEVVDTNNSTDTDKSGTSSDDYEDICYICRRPESVAGKMIHITGGISICVDCMQKTFDTMGNYGPGNMFPAGFPQLDPDDSHTTNNAGNGGFPVFNLNDIASFLSTSPQVPANQRIKKRKEQKEGKKGEESEGAVIDIKNIPPPHKIKAELDEYIVGQEKAKKIMSVAVYNHYKRIIESENLLENDEDDDVVLEKSNILMLGPTGCGKTYMVKTLARLLDVPLAITDATSLTEAGYIGDDIESVVSKLLAAADNDVERAEKGIIFIDEIDKLAKKNSATNRDINGESVQQGMLKLLEGAEVEVPVGASSKNAMVPMTMVDTSNILFICGGAFPRLTDVIKERLKRSSSIGFVSDLGDEYDNDEKILDKVTAEDLRKFGFIPEFIGRLPVICTLDPLDTDMLVRILTEPKNAIIKQYQKLLALDEVKLSFDEKALSYIAEEAKKRKLGARALRSIIEGFMNDIMYEIPKDPDIGEVTITREYIEGKGSPLITMRTDEKKEITASDK